MNLADTLPSVALSPDFRAIDPLTTDDWDNFLAKHADATVFHAQGWARVLAESYGYTPKYLLAGTLSEMDALLPLFEIRSPLTGIRGVSLPFTDRCDAIVSPRAGLQALLAHARMCGQQGRWKYLELRTSQEPLAEASAVYYQHDLNLTPSEETLFANCESAMRRAIRKAEKGEIQIEASTSGEALECYYRLHTLTRQKHGLPPQPLKFFRKIHEHLIAKGHGTVLLARAKTAPIAGAIFLHFGKSSIYKFGASDPKFQELRPNNLLLWKGILEMKRIGARSLSFGRTSLGQDGLRRFKLAFGSTESMLHYFRYSFPLARFIAGQPDRSSGWHATLGRWCPRVVARLAGAIIYPHIG